MYSNPYTWAFEKMKIVQLFIFYANGVLDCICEGIENVGRTESYLLSRFNNVEVRSVIAEDYDAAWDVFIKHMSTEL